MNLIRSDRFFANLLIFILLAGCAAPAANSPQPASPSNLTVYSTTTVPVKPIPTVPATEIPIPTPTPSTYTISQGDTLLGVAQRSGISLNDLLAANPGIVPQALSVGQVIKVPAPPADVLPPLSASAELGLVDCYSSGSGLYCLVPVHNPGEGLLENVKVQIALLDADGSSVASQEALLPLTILPAGKTLPAAAFFPGVRSASAQQAQLTTAIALATADERYLPAEAKDVLTSIAWGGRSAQVQGQIVLPADSKPASSIWLAGVAYDAHNVIVGFRRWEWSGSLAPGSAQAFSFFVYSTGAAIERVEIVVEARP